VTTCGNGTYTQCGGYYDQWGNPLCEPHSLASGAPNGGSAAALVPVHVGHAFVLTGASLVPSVSEL
jgi:hypothetical protein